MAENAETPKAPAGNAATNIWADYAKALGATDEDLAGLGRDEIKEFVANLQPGDPAGAEAGAEQQATHEGATAESTGDTAPAGDTDTETPEDGEQLSRAERLANIAAGVQAAKPVNAATPEPQAPKVKQTGEVIDSGTGDAQGIVLVDLFQFTYKDGRPGWATKGQTIKGSAELVERGVRFKLLKLAE
ncbi:hypothetical protein [Nesterenkonia rhizosphaerae]|uniref:Uncharacterized protein n=1 Tax=Nesterenkonia rhizosphaerae TaxID=1348272 RepID=A0ABP9FSU5_9MICC